MKQAATLLDRFCILDLKFADNQTKHNIAVKEFRRYIGPDNLKYGAAYTPHLKTAGSNPVILPASAAVAGQYCYVDASRGVWKAPANVGLAYVGQLLYTITNNEQDGLNIDVNAGKSINAIRSFTGRGFLIWGARTLDGNDNEWRYVPVRRFFMVVEESIKKACLPFVFERNDANTWSKVKSLIENYLTLIWRDGAMAGSSPREAFFVKVGLGETMTAGDVQQGNMIFEIGMAAVRPAEFIIIRISQKMAQ